MFPPNLDDNRLKKTSDYENYSQPEASINKMPIKLFNKILSYLHDNDLKSASKVSSEWRVVAMETAKKKQLSKIKNFANFLADQLPNESYSSQKEKLTHIGSGKKLLDSVNIMEIKSSIHELREGILNILKELKEEDLNHLEGFSKEVKPTFFENLFELSRIYQEIDQANALIDDKVKTEALVTICHKLMRAGHFTKAKEVASTIPDEDARGKTHTSIFFDLIEEGNFVRAVDFIKTLPENERAAHLMVVFVKSLEVNDIKMAVDLADTFPHDETKSGAYESIFKELIEKQKPEEAIKIAKSLSLPESIKEKVLQNLTDKLITENYLDNALDVAHMLSDVYTKEYVLMDLCNRFAQKGEYSRARSIANTIPDDTVREFISSEIEKIEKNAS